MKLSFALAACGLLGGCRSLDMPQYPGNASAGVEARSGEYRLQPGDRVAVRFPLYTQWNAELVVRPDGFVSAPLAGEIELAGLGLAQARERISTALSGRIRSNAVELLLLEQRPREVYVGGEVVKPGSVLVSGPELTLDQALAAAGGARFESARLEQIVIARVGVDGVRRVWRHDYLGSLRDGAGAEPVLLAAGDVVLVPNSGIDELNIWVEQHISRMIPGGGLLGTALLLKAAP